MSKELHEAAQDRLGLDKVIALLEKDPSIIDDKHPESSMTAIEYAAQKGSLETVQYLLEKGANIDASNGRENLLYWASFNTEEVIEYLTNPDHKILEKINDGTTDFHAAILAGNIDVLAENESITLFTNCNNKHQASIFWAFLSKNTIISEFLLATMAANMPIATSDYIDLMSYTAYILSQSERTFDTAIGLMKKTIENLMTAPSFDNQEMTEIHLYFLITFLSIENMNDLLEKEYRTKFNECCRLLASKLSSKVLSWLEDKRIPTSALEQENLKTQEQLNEIDELVKRLNLAKQVIQRGIQCLPNIGEFYEVLVHQLHSLKNPQYAEMNAYTLRNLALEHIKKYREIYQVYSLENLETYFGPNSKSLPEELAIPALSRELNMSFCIFKSNLAQPEILKQEDAVATLSFAYLHKDEKPGYYIHLKTKTNCIIDISLKKETEETLPDFFKEEVFALEIANEKAIIHEPNEKSIIIKRDEKNIISNRSFRPIRDNFSYSLQFFGPDDVSSSTSNVNTTSTTSTTSTTTTQGTQSMEMKPNF